MKIPADSIRGLVLDIDRFATHDGPGIRTAVFLKGCALRCTWCHSPESQSFQAELIFMENRCTACGLCLEACPRGALTAADPGGSKSSSRIALDRAACDSCGACAEVCYPGALKMFGEWRQAGALAAEIARDSPFFQASGGGVTLTGGEASQQGAFAAAFLTACRRFGLATAVETNGAASWRVLERMARVTDLILFDLKHMDPIQHRRLTGVPNRIPHANLRRLVASGAKVEVRVPCIPGINDSSENIQATAEFVHLLGLHTIHLLRYNPAAGAKYTWLGRVYPYPELTPQSSQELEALAEICRSARLQVTIDG